MVDLADEIERYPESYLHARELGYEIKRLRPKWIHSVPFTSRVRQFLGTHREHWQRAKAGVNPSPADYVDYTRDHEDGITQKRRTQKGLRTAAGGGSDFVLMDLSGATIPVDITDPGMFWRVEGLQVWHNAIEIKHPASRDYADWLRPYLRARCFRDESYSSFWLTEASSQALPLNRLTSLISFYQLRHKISHGNSADQLHGGHWLRSEFFLTADRAFHEVLTDVAPHFPERPMPFLIRRSDPSFAKQLEKLLHGKP